MTLDWTHDTPWASLGGGLLIAPLPAARVDAGPISLIVAAMLVDRVVHDRWLSHS